jgi:hypothetical protein
VRLDVELTLGCQDLDKKVLFISRNDCQYMALTL